MRATDWLRSRSVELGWVAFAALNLVAMTLWGTWETIPFHFVWISLTLVYGFRVWRPEATSLVLAVVIVTTGAAISFGASEGKEQWAELFEVPLMSAMFLAMVWHARRRQAAMREAQELADSRASLLELQERFLHDVSHELRTPVTIARGHLELHGRAEGDAPELAVALDELARIERIIARLLLLAKAERPDFLAVQEVDVEPFLEDVFMRWSEVAPRVWRLGTLARGRLRADEEAVRAALDALLENAVKFTDASEPIELRAVGLGDDVVLEVADGGSGVPEDALERIFERFGRADDARTRTNGGAGLGLSIVSAIARAHGWSCEVRRQPRGSVFSVRLPGFRPSGASAVANGFPRAEESSPAAQSLAR